METGGIASVAMNQLESVDGDACDLQAEVGRLKHPDLGSSETVAVGHGKDGVVALIFDGSKKSAHLILGKEGDSSVLSPLVGRGWF